MLARSPAFTLGIGANTAIFSVADAVLFRSLPYRGADRLVIVTHARGPNRRPFTYNRARFIDDRSRAFTGFAPFVTENFNLTGRGEPELLASARVAWNFFDVRSSGPDIDVAAEGSESKIRRHDSDDRGGHCIERQEFADNAGETRQSCMKPIRSRRSRFAVALTYLIAVARLRLPLDQGSPTLIRGATSV